MVLLTGFGPFKDVKINTSSLIVERVDGGTVAGSAIRTAILPVSYRRVKPLLEELIRDEGEAAILTGLASTAPCIRVEAVALNVAHSTIPDNDGYTPYNKPIYPGAPLALKTRVSVEELVNKLRSAGIPVTISFDGGTYLCNYAYYIALYNARCPAVFLHVPNATEAVIDEPSHPSLPLDMLVRAVKIVAEEVLKSSRPHECLAGSEKGG